MLRQNFATLLLLLALISSTTNCFAKKWTLNKIVARVNGANILQSDLTQPQVDKDGKTLKLDEAIMEQLYIQRAKEKHMIPSTSDVQRQIVSLKMANDIAHLNDQEFETQLKEELGISLDQYKIQLTKILAIEKIKQAEVSEKTFVSSQEVEAHYKKNPAFSKEQFHLKICSFTKNETDNYKSLIKNNQVVWKDLGLVNKEDIDPQFVSVIKMQPKQITKPIKSGDKFIALMLFDKLKARRKTLQECYGKIERKLQQEKQNIILQQLSSQLKKQAFITFP